MPVYSENIIFEKSLCNILNNLATSFEKVATYEIQTQYCLKSQTISLDGIVGGEILPYFKINSNLVDFFEKYKPSYLVLSDYIIYRNEYRNTILEDLYNRDSKVAVGSEVNISNIKFVKIAENYNDSSIETKKGMRHWLSIYKLKYD